MESKLTLIADRLLCGLGVLMVISGGTGFLLCVEDTPLTLFATLMTLVGVVLIAVYRHGADSWR